MKRILAVLSVVLVSSSLAACTFFSRSISTGLSYLTALAIQAPSLTAGAFQEALTQTAAAKISQFHFGSLPAGGMTPMAPPGSGGRPIGTGWNLVVDNAYGFEYAYPVGGAGACGGSTANCEVHNSFWLPFTPGTNLVEKLMFVDVQVNPTTCQSPWTAGFAPGSLNPVNETFNGLNWVEETFEQGAAGNLYQYTAYSTSSGSVCVSMTFVLHSHTAGGMVTIPPTFNQAQESAIFPLIVYTFEWLTGSAVTPTHFPFSATFVPIQLTPPWSFIPTPFPTQTPESLLAPTPTHTHVKLVLPTPTRTRSPAG